MAADRMLPRLRFALTKRVLQKPQLIYFWLYTHLASGSSIFSSEVPPDNSRPPATVISSIMSLCQANMPATILRASFLSTDIISQRKMEITKRKEIHLFHPSTLTHISNKHNNNSCPPHQQSHIQISRTSIKFLQSAFKQRRTSQTVG